jgi:hypothetical protein
MGRVKRKSVSLTHMAFSTTPSLRASATLARLAPRRRATFIAQALSMDQEATRVMITCAASNSATRTEASPARLMAPSRSVSPDWYLRGVRPKHAPCEPGVSWRGRGSGNFGDRCLNRLGGDADGRGRPCRSGQRNLVHKPNHPLQVVQEVGETDLGTGPGHLCNPRDDPAIRSQIRAGIRRPHPAASASWWRQMGKSIGSGVPSTKQVSFSMSWFRAGATRKPPNAYSASFSRSRAEPLVV